MTFDTQSRIPSRTRTPGTSWCAGIAIILIVLYLVAPIIAGYCSYGYRDGPKIYPVVLHSPLFRVGIWLAGRDDKIPLSWGEESRPFFYGMYSAKYEPEVRIHHP